MVMTRIFIYLAPNHHGDPGIPSKNARKIQVSDLKSFVQIYILLWYYSTKVFTAIVLLVREVVQVLALTVVSSREIPFLFTFKSRLGDKNRSNSATCVFFFPGIFLQQTGPALHPRFVYLMIFYGFYRGIHHHFSPSFWENVFYFFQSP